MYVLDRNDLNDSQVDMSDEALLPTLGLCFFWDDSLAWITANGTSKVSYS